ncbi:hypothetical protein [Pseudacidovorax sp. NFM-22]|nr:hypothetical protein [Pseudacidovorax sp. NFM-22]
MPTLNNFFLSRSQRLVAGERIAGELYARVRQRRAADTGIDKAGLL